MGHSIFITGTDTSVGKTFFTTGIIQMLREMGLDVVGFKPIECGGRNDSLALQTASGNEHDLDEINPIWLELPLCPLAAWAETMRQSDNETIRQSDNPLDLIKEAHQRLVDQHELVFVEGAGGWQVPITAQIFMADLAADLCDEVIIVAANRLGVINHALLTYRAIRERKMDCARLILNHPPCFTTDLSLTTNAEMIHRCEPSLEVFPLRDESCFADLARAIFFE